MTPGKYVLVCNLADHYQMGMRAPFTVHDDADAEAIARRRPAGRPRPGTIGVGGRGDPVRRWR